MNYIDLWGINNNSWLIRAGIENVGQHFKEVSEGTWKLRLYRTDNTDISTTLIVKTYENTFDWRNLVGEFYVLAPENSLKLALGKLGVDRQYIDRLTIFRDPAYQNI